MKTKKWLAAITIISAILPISAINADYNKNSAQTYLESHGDNPWSIMALTVLGQTPSSTAFLSSINGKNAIDYEAPILAITALGQNPRTFGSTDYIAALKGYRSNNQIGDVTTVNDDIFGILALVSAGESPDDSTIADAKNFITGRQNSDGGWGFIAASDSDTNMTSSAILALLAAGVASSDSHIQNALKFLQNSQNSDGGFPYSPGAASDSSSTAWTMWALNALNISPSSWNKSGHTPVSYLESNQSNQGFFKFQPSSSEDGFSATTTAYTVIALQGKYLPVRTAAGTVSQKFSFRIEGSAANICSGETEAVTALDIVKNAKDLCGYTYDIKDTSFGPYLDQIDSDTASGNTGWMYLVNNIAPNAGAADYKLQTNDSVLWYFGDFGLIPARLKSSADKIGSGQSVAVMVESFSNNLWSPLPDAIVHYGADTANTDSNGKVNISPKDGFYKLLAQKQGCIRSNASLLQVGEPLDSVVNLNVNIQRSNQNPPENSVSFTVAPSALDFGTLAPGASSTKNFTITNNGSVDIHVESMISGDAVFTGNMKLNSVPWDNFRADIAKNASQNVAAGLSVPEDYSDSGAKSGQLTVWAMAE